MVLAPDVIIRNARLLDRTDLTGIHLSGGRIAAVGEVPAGGPSVEEIDAAGGLVSPSFIDAHFHPDKALTFPRVGPIDDASPEASLARGADVRRTFTGPDVTERSRRAIGIAVSQGIGAMRIQVDIDSAFGLTAFDSVVGVSEEFADRVDLQIVAFPQEGVLRDPGVIPLLRKALQRGATIIGGGPDNEERPDQRDEHLDAIFDLAAEFDVDIDMHIDLIEDPGSRGLARLAEKTIEHGWRGRVNAVHCCALAAYPDDYAQSVIAAVRDAGIQVCICPMGNLLLVGGDVTPHGRGTSRPKELLAAGVNVAAGSDNLNDMWFRFGRLDPVQLAMVTCLAGGMRTDKDVRDAFDMVTTRGARYLSLPDYGIAVGNRADLVVFSAATIEDVLRDVPGTRTTIKSGRVVGRYESSTWLSD